MFKMICHNCRAYLAVDVLKIKNLHQFELVVNPIRDLASLSLSYQDLWLLAELCYDEPVPSGCNDLANLSLISLQK